MKPSTKPVWIVLLLSSAIYCFSQDLSTAEQLIRSHVYPDVMEQKPDLPSPFKSSSGEEYVIAVTKENKFALMEVTLHNERDICRQLVVDTADFPHLAETGLHSPETLNHLETITGRSLDTITRLGRPGGLSSGGFMAEDEDILSVIKGDDLLVRSLGLTHPQLATPLFHVLNMMDTDLSLDRWNMARHQWENIQYFYYNNRKVYVEAHDTKGGQRSIFDDGLEGAFYIKLWREPDPEETEYLNRQYDYLSEVEMEKFRNTLSVIHTGELEPQYIMRYGFYEGHTFWRTDPLALSFIFGLKSLEELHAVMEGDVYTALTAHYPE